jgi:hypothetical protein
MSNINFCPECGTKVEVGWNSCPNCGYHLKDSYIPESSKELEPNLSVQEPIPAPPPYTYKPSAYTPSQGGSVFGGIALASGIIGLCCLGIIFGIIALIFGIIGQVKDVRKGLSTAGIILGILDICCTSLLFFFPISYFF